MVQPVNEYAYIAAMNCVTMNTIAVYMENEPTADRRAAQRKTHTCVAQLARDQRSRFTSRHALEVGRAA